MELDSDDKMCGDNVSFSMMVDKEPSSVNYNSIQARTLNQWVEDETVSECIKCKRIFGLWYRKHHCRKCGYIYCSYCTEYRISIPKYVKVPKPLISEEVHDGKEKRVCEMCYKKLNKLYEFESTLKMLESAEVDLNQMRQISQKSRIHKQYVNYYLSRFREIQYLLPNHVYTNFERHVLWVNRHLLVGHCLWITHLIKSIDYEKEHDKIPEVLQLLEKHKNVEERDSDGCWNLMCTRLCQNKMSNQCTLMLLDRKILCPEIHKYALEYLEKISIPELLCYIQYLIENGTQSPYQIIVNWLIAKSSENIEIAHKVFWAIQCGLDTKSSVISTKYNGMLMCWKQKVPMEIQTKIYKNYNFVQAIRKNYNSTELENINKALKVFKSVPLPTNPKICNLKVLSDKIKIKNSATRPILIPMQHNNGYFDKNILYKDEDIRKDQIIMDIIRLMDIILKNEGINLDIITYDILATSSTDGLIEIVPNSKTLYDIRFKEKQSLLHYILMNNRNSNVDTLLNRFMKSCAAYCVITFLLGVGDRHLENIMITDTGTFFHIDYGYILSMDPKFISTSDIRISEDMIGVMGGVNSSLYKEFKELCEQIFNALRRHVNIFTCLLNLLSYSQPHIQPHFTQQQILSEIEKRFVPGETHQQAKIQIHNRIDNSTSTTYKYRLIDFLHRQMDIQDGMLGNINITINSGKNLFQSFMDLIQSLQPQQ